MPSILFFYFFLIRMEKSGREYSEERRYQIARRMIHIMKRNGGIRTKAYGVENLPQSGGYVMFPNHQGKYDVLGIMSVHKNPCTMMIDEERSRMLFANEFTTLLRGCRIDKTTPKSQVKAVLQVVREVKEGRRYIVFPEGGYDENENRLQEFLPGSFQCAMKAKSPIVPVALVDSFKVFDMKSWSIRPVCTQVFFLEPIFSSEYEGMRTSEVADLVKNRIEDAILNSKSSRMNRFRRS